VGGKNTGTKENGKKSLKRKRLDVKNLMGGTGLQSERKKIVTAKLLKKTAAENRGSLLRGEIC